MMIRVELKSQTNLKESLASSSTPLAEVMVDGSKKFLSGGPRIGRRLSNKTQLKEVVIGNFF